MDDVIRFCAKHQLLGGNEKTMRAMFEEADGTHSGRGFCSAQDIQAAVSFRLARAPTSQDPTKVCRSCHLTHVLVACSHSVYIS